MSRKCIWGDFVLSDIVLLLPVFCSIGKGFAHMAMAIDGRKQRCKTYRERTFREPFGGGKGSYIGNYFYNYCRCVLCNGFVFGLLEKLRIVIYKVTMCWPAWRHLGAIEWNKILLHFSAILIYCDCVKIRPAYMTIDSGIEIKEW